MKLTEQRTSPTARSITHRNAVLEMVRANLGIMIVIVLIGLILSFLSPVFRAPTTCGRFCSRLRPTSISH